jgi:NarL family two-component system response regulator LiaR
MSDTSDANAIRILIADNHPLMRRGLRSLLALEPGVELVGEAEDGVVAVAQARALRPDVILIDLLMPRQDGLQAIAEIVGQNPEARILVLTALADDDQAFQVIQAGARGYLLKDLPARELLRAIRDVYRGERTLHPAVAGKVNRELDGTPLLTRPARSAPDLTRPGDG